MAVKSNWPAEEDVCRRVIAAIVKLYQHDGELLDRDASERSVTHKLAEHLQKEFPSWHVDCEYNRADRNPKRLKFTSGGTSATSDDLDTKAVLPDIVVHLRGTKRNLVVIEIKKAGRESDKSDREKIQAFVDPKSYGYRFGFVARLGMDGRASLERYNQQSLKWDRWSDQLRRALMEFGYGG